MPETNKTLRTCSNGHQYYKSTDCPTCPICEREKKPENEFLGTLGAPARRALQNAGINTVQQLSVYSQKEIMKLHGMGPSTLPKLKAALEAEGLAFKQ